MAEPSAEYEDIRARVLRTAERMFEERQEINPMFAIILFEGGRVMPCTLPNMSGDEQRGTIQGMLEQLSFLRPLVVFHVMEMWFAAVDPNSPEFARLVADEMNGKICERPDRQECVVVHQESLNLAVRGWTARIIRGDGAPRLDSWQERQLLMPYPGFRRYFPHDKPKAAQA